MTLYRALTNLSKGEHVIERGSVFLGTMLSEDSRTKLLNLGRIAEASAPPLAAIPNWAARAAKMSKVGITTVEEFITVPDAELAKTLKVSPQLAAEYKTALLSCLKTPDPQG